MIIFIINYNIIYYYDIIISITLQFDLHGFVLNKLINKLTFNFFCIGNFIILLMVLGHTFIFYILIY